MVDIYDRAGKAAEVGTDLFVKGAGVAGGLIGGKFLGDTVEQAVTTPVTEVSSMTDKFIAWLSNNLPKGVGAYVLSQYGHTSSEMVNKALEGVTYGLAGSVAVDTYSRAANKGVPTLILNGSPAANQRIQALLQENASLKQSLQRVSSQKPASVRIERVEGPPSAPLQRQYEFTPGASGVPGVVYEKRPLERQYEFTGAPAGKSVTSKEVLISGFGFDV